MHPPRQYTAKLEEKTVFNQKYTQYDFELLEPHELLFEAGQYVSLKVSPEGMRRSYSICSSPAITHGFQLLVDLEPQGVGSQFLQGLEYGAVIEFLGPLGRFVIADSTQEEPPLVLIATGSGITPYRSMVLDLLQNKQTKRSITLYWGMRYAEQLFWQDEFQELMDAFPNFKFHPVISKPVAGWSLCSGRVTDCLQVHTLPPSGEYYLCGNTPMVADVTKILVDQGVLESAIHHEKFY